MHLITYRDLRWTTIFDQMIWKTMNRKSMILLLALSTWGWSTLFLYSLFYFRTLTVYFTHRMFLTGLMFFITWLYNNQPIFTYLCVSELLRLMFIFSPDIIQTFRRDFSRDLIVETLFQRLYKIYTIGFGNLAQSGVLFGIAIQGLIQKDKSEPWSDDFVAEVKHIYDHIEDIKVGYVDNIIVFLLQHQTWLIWLVGLQRIKQKFFQGDINCPVCMENQKNVALYQPICGHNICAQCIVKWTVVQPTCPICRARL